MFAAGITGCTNSFDNEEETPPTPLRICASIAGGNTRSDKTAFSVGDIITVVCGNDTIDYKYTESISHWEPANGGDGLIITKTTATCEATYSDINGDDLCASTAVSALDPTAIFSFEHAKAKMVIKLSANNENNILSGAKYSITGLESRYECQQEIPEEGEITVYITTYTTEFQLNIVTADNQTYRATISGLSLTAGYRYMCNVTVG
jgi:hypothetical protein